MPFTILLGAEGCSETNDEDWIRDATDEEATALANRLGIDRVRAYVVDHNGRPYWIKVVLDHAPPEILDHASRIVRTVRLEAQRSHFASQPKEGTNDRGQAS